MRTASSTPMGCVLQRHSLAPSKMHMLDSIIQLRERFWDQIFQFSLKYQLYFAKHDEGRNARFHDLDGGDWIMLMAFPEDARNNSAIVKAVSGFGLLHYWHDTNNIERVVARILLHDDAKIPQDVTVDVGLPPHIRTWTFPVFILKKKGATMLADEDLVLPKGLLHPLPNVALRWIGSINELVGSVA